MHRVVFEEFERICSEERLGETVLEVGAVPNDHSLLNMKSLDSVREKTGINLDGPYIYKDFHIVKGDANHMPEFDDASFDLVLCNAMLEHDKYFWKTISEIKRVVAPGGLIVIGTPGYIKLPKEAAFHSIFKGSRRITQHRLLNFMTTATLTFGIHNAPGDYYRFSPQTFREVFFEGMQNIEVHSVMLPPRIIGSARKP